MTDAVSGAPAEEDPQTRVLALTARIVSAHVAHNLVCRTELPGLIHMVSHTLARVGGSSSSLAGFAGRRPAVPINRSVFLDYIVCLESGRRFRTLRRHLKAAFDLTPEAYRRRWGLPYDYPMIAPGYAKARSEVAKATRLGHTSRIASKAAGRSGPAL